MLKLNNDEEENNNHSIKIEVLVVNPERRSYERTLRRKYSKKDVGQYFDVINEIKLISWEDVLFESIVSNHNFSSLTDADILNEQFNDLKTIKIIKGDIERTRVQESIYMTSFKDYVYQIIIYYINKYNIPYKQGLNEIAGPFVLLKYKLNISLDRIYKLFVCFIDKFLTNYFHENDFFSLKSTFCLINLLLRYHDPKLFHLFEHCIVIPDLYATSWIMTLFSNKCSLTAIYHLWDKLILFNDNLFTIFFIVALLILNREKCINSDSSIILSMLSQMEINEIDEINTILNLANEIRDKTPDSFYLLSNKLDIFNYNSKNLQIFYEKYLPDKMMALPMFSTELFCLTYKNIKGCPDENCQNFLKNEKCDNLSKCIFCRNRQLKKKIAYIIIDLRIFKSDKNEEKNILSSDTSPGFLPKTLRITEEELNDENYPKNILNEYKKEKENYHFIIITSETYYFEQYEKEFYKDSSRSSNKRGVYYKKTRELDEQKVNDKFKNKNTKEYFLLKEYDNFKKLIEEMNIDGFKYVSYAYSGYKEIHDCAIKYNIDLLEHGEKCFLCKGEQKNNFFKFW